MGAIQVSHLGWRLPGGLDLLTDVSFSVGDGDRTALIGANGVGKTTLMRLIAGDLTPTSGTLTIDGRLGVMRQLVGTTNGSDGGQATVRELLVSLAPPGLQASARRASPPPRADRRMIRWPMPRRWPTGATTAGTPPSSTGTSASREPSGSASTTSPTGRCARSPAASGSGWCSSYCSAATTRSCCSTSPTTSSTCRQALARARVRASTKTILFVTHDRELLAAVSDGVVTAGGPRHVDPRPGSPGTTRLGAPGAPSRLAEDRGEADEQRMRQSLPSPDAPAGPAIAERSPPREGGGEPTARSTRPSVRLTRLPRTIVTSDCMAHAPAST